MTAAVNTITAIKIGIVSERRLTEMLGTPERTRYFSFAEFSAVGPGLVTLFAGLWKLDHSPCWASCSITPPSTHPTLIKQKAPNKMAAMIRIFRTLTQRARCTAFLHPRLYNENTALSSNG